MSDVGILVLLYFGFLFLKLTVLALVWRHTYRVEARARERQEMIKLIREEKRELARKIAAEQLRRQVQKEKRDFAVIKDTTYL